MQIAAEVTEPACPESGIHNALLSLDDCNIVELGCGAAELTHDIATGGRNRSILALEVIEFSDFDDFEKRVIQATHSDHQLSTDVYREVQKHFAGRMTENGGRFTIPIRVDLLRKPALDA